MKKISILTLIIIFVNFYSIHSICNDTMNGCAISNESDLDEALNSTISFSFLTYDLIMSKPLIINKEVVIGLFYPLSFSSTGTNTQIESGANLTILTRRTLMKFAKSMHVDISLVEDYFHPCRRPIVIKGTEVLFNLENSTLNIISDDGVTIGDGSSNILINAKSNSYVKLIGNIIFKPGDNGIGIDITNSIGYLYGNSTLTFEGGSDYIINIKDSTTFILTGGVDFKGTKGISIKNSDFDYTKTNESSTLNFGSSSTSLAFDVENSKFMINATGNITGSIPIKCNGESVCGLIGYGLNINGDQYSVYSKNSELLINGTTSITGPINLINGNMQIGNNHTNDIKEVNELVQISTTSGNAITLDSSSALISCKITLNSPEQVINIKGTNSNIIFWNKVIKLYSSTYETLYNFAEHNKLLFSFTPYSDKCTVENTMTFYDSNNNPLYASIYFDDLICRDYNIDTSKKSSNYDDMVLYKDEEGKEFLKIGNKGTQLNSIITSIEIGGDDTVKVKGGTNVAVIVIATIGGIIIIAICAFFIYRHFNKKSAVDKMEKLTSSFKVDV